MLSPISHVYSKKPMLLDKAKAFPTGAPDSGAKFANHRVHHDSIVSCARIPVAMSVGIPYRTYLWRDLPHKVHKCKCAVS